MLSNLNEVLHELKTPISIIKGYSDILANNPELNEETRKVYTQKIYEKSVATEQLIIDFSNMLKSQDTGDIYSFEVCDVNSLVTNCLDDFAVLFELSGISPEFTTSSKEIFCKIDKAKMNSVFSNLMQNAIKYTGKGGKLLISSSTSGGDSSSFLFIIRDTGAGISSEQCDKIFEKYYTANNDHFVVNSHGLGLYICKTIIEKHGGKIWAESDVGKGMAMFFSIPCNY